MSDETKLHPYQKEILKIIKSGKRVVLLTGRRHGLTSGRRLYEELRKKEVLDVG